MIENNKNRFTDNETDCLIDSSFTDNLTKKNYGIDEWERIIGLCNNLWEQTQRFEKENQRLNIEIEQLNQEIWDSGTACAEEVTKIEDEFDKEISRLVKENNELKSKFSVQLDSLKDENKNLKKENKDLEELLHLITGIFSFKKEESVKELLRNEIRGLDAVSYEFAGAWNDYCILSKFFQERYGEHWDNE